MASAKCLPVKEKVSVYYLESILSGYESKTLKSKQNGKIRKTKEKDN
ncbi:MAG: hypothetical protein HRT68_03950 [Flavobacteriaceae bacterium]|nr:hypothetical protein [Flavobacteriaceae bacterium]